MSAPGKNHELQVSAHGKNVRAPDPPAPTISKTLRPLGGVGIWLAPATSSQGTKKTYVLVPGSPQLSAIDIKDVLVRVDKYDLRTSSGPDTGTHTAQLDTKLSSINSLIRGQAGTTVELEFVSETGQQKTVRLRLVATAGPPTPLPSSTVTVGHARGQTDKRASLFGYEDAERKDSLRPVFFAGQR